MKKLLLKFSEEWIVCEELFSSKIKMERFVIIVNGWKPLNIITKRPILDVAAVLDPTLSDFCLC